MTSTQQLREHSEELLMALTNLTNAPIFDAENFEDGPIDPVTEHALVQANTALLNATQPYLPFYKDDIAAPL